MTRQFGKLAHSLYECKYHVIFLSEILVQNLAAGSGSTRKAANLSSQ